MTISSHWKAYCLMGLLCLNASLSNGQNKKLVDSLIQLYESGSYQGQGIDLLKRIAEEETDPHSVLEFSDLLIEKASADSSFSYLHSGYLQRGNSLTRLGENSRALEAYLKSLAYAERTRDQIGIGSLMIAIAGTYTQMEDSQSALPYYKKGIEILRETKDSIKIATSLLNTGDLYINMGILDTAFIYTSEAVQISDILNFQLGRAYGIGNLGMIYASQGDDELAEKSIKEAIGILEQLEDYYPISVYLTYMSDIYLRKGDYDMALNYASKGLELAKKYNLKEEISEANLKLAELYEQNGNYKLSNAFLKDHYLYRDSVLNIEAVKQMANLRTEYEVSQKQVEVDLLNEQKRNQRIVVFATGTAFFLIALLAVGLFRRNKFISHTKKIIENEKNRSERLLLNILPEETAAELKDKGKVQARRIDSVSVMFTDFKGFTAYSDQLSPEELVDSIDFYYSKFDEIIERYGLEKIKTVGDAYMCAGGLPYPTQDHALKTVAAALEIARFVNESKESDPDDMTRFDIRIGINTGPVVAGVVGTKKFAYDIWGDTVNIASRMESNSEPGKINISEYTYQLIKDQYDCTYRGKFEAKNKGLMEMYFVNRKLDQEA